MDFIMGLVVAIIIVIGLCDVVNYVIDKVQAKDKKSKKVSKNARKK